MVKTKTGLFGRKKTSMTNAPEEDESPEEIEHIEKLSKQEPTTQIKEIPVAISKTQIHNLVIENNLMLKEIISNIE